MAISRKIQLIVNLKAAKKLGANRWNAFTPLAAAAILLFGQGSSAIADNISSTLSQLESIAFGQSQSGDDEQRLTALEKKAYGIARTGDFSQRIAAMQHFMGVPAPTDGSDGHMNVRINPVGTETGGAQNNHDNTGSSSAITLPPHRQPLEASVSSRQWKLEAGDDERFGGVWIGTLSSKIDPHVKVYCELHGSGSHFTGTMIWTSAVCGGCRRTIVGYFDNKDQACMMKDLRVEALNQTQAVKFCTVDRYAFGITENAEKLSGWFHSAQCKDEGAVTLTRYREQQ